MYKIISNIFLQKCRNVKSWSKRKILQYFIPTFSSQIIKVSFLEISESGLPSPFLQSRLSHLIPGQSRIDYMGPANTEEKKVFSHLSLEVFVLA